MTLIMMMMAITVIMTFKKIKLLTLGLLLFFYSHAYIQFQLVRSRHTGVSTLNSHKLEMYWRAINTIWGAITAASFSRLSQFRCMRLSGFPHFQVHNLYNVNQSQSE